MSVTADKAYKKAEKKIELALRTQKTTLDLIGSDENHLLQLPESVGRLTQLRVLNLSQNKLTALSESVGHLTQLRELRLFGNELAALP